MNHRSTVEYLTLRQLFIAYARVRASRDKPQVIRDYHEKKWRILSSLFEIRLDDPSGLEALADCHARAAFYDPCGG